MRRRTCLILLSVGLGILAGGLVYDLVLGGLLQGSSLDAPQDTLVHARIARTAEAIGLLIWSLGAINAALMYMHRRESHNREKRLAAGDMKRQA